MKHKFTDHRPATGRAVWVLSTGALALLLAAACAPNQDTRTATTGSAPPASAAGGQAGLRAQIDPATGALTSERPAGQDALQSSSDPLNWSSEGLVHETLPDGTVRVDLQGRFRNSSYAVAQPDGSVEIRYSEPSDDSDERSARGKADSHDDGDRGGNS